MQKNQLYRNATLSFIIINFWSLYCFFDYFTDEAAFLRGLGVLFDFYFTTLFCLTTGVVLLILRLFVFKKDKGYKLKNNIVYLLEYST
jgi:hypothetical protein